VVAAPICEGKWTVKLLLIQPRSEWSIMGQTSRGKAGMPRLTLPALAAVTPPDVDVRIVDCRVQAIDYEAPVDLVGITAMTCEAPGAYEIADAFRARNVPVVMGGYHASFMPEEVRLHADAVVIGEAELIWRDVIEDFRSGRPRSSYMADRLCDLAADVPVPRRDLLDRTKYFTFNTIQATRGCSKGCGYCSVGAFFGPTFRKRCPDDVVSEIKGMLSPRPDRKGRVDRYFVFIDDNLTLDRGYAMQLFKALAPLGIKWGCQATTELAEDAELLRLATLGGCIFVSVGFESFNPLNVARLRKNWAAAGMAAGKATAQPLEAVCDGFRRTVDRFHKQGVCVLGNFMLGFDNDDSDVVAKTIRASLEINVDLAYFHILTPMPGTMSYDDLAREDRITTRDWTQYDSAHVVFTPKLLSPGELQADLWQAYRKYYSIGRIARRVFRSPHQLGARLGLNWSTRRKWKRLMARFSYLDKMS
jgi:radical SAM superfamily enzyme YgiQ (UPF0313 family)